MSPDAIKTGSTSDSKSKIEEKKGPVEIDLPASGCKLSKRRWLILMSIGLFGFLNGFTNEINAILRTTVNLLEIHVDQYVYLSQVFFYIIPILGIPTAWFVDKFGLKHSFRVNLLVVIIRNISRALFFLPHLSYWEEFRFAYWFLFNFFQQLNIVLYYCMPLKIAENWFSASEKSIAWTTIVVLPILGSACSSLITPQIVLKFDSTDLLAYLNLLAALISTITILTCITKSKPKHPPSERQLKENCSIEQQSLIGNLKLLFKNGNILIQLILVSSFETFVVTLNTLLQDVLAVSGFSSIETGQFLATMAIASVLLQTISSLVSKKDHLDADKRNSEGDKRFAERLTKRCKIYVTLLCLSFLLYSSSLSGKNHTESHWWLAVVSSLVFTFLRFWLAPLLNDLLAFLIAGQISQATVGAMQMIFQAISSNLCSVLFVYLRQVQHVVDEASGIRVAKVNYLWSIVFIGGSALFVTCLYLIWFTGEKKSLEQRQRHDDNS